MGTVDGTTDRPAAIRCRGLTRRYGTVNALDGLDLEVPPGAVYAVIGPNGAGKSTAVKVFCGLVPFHDGACTVLGLDPRRDAVTLAARIGVVPDFPVLFDVLSPRENVLRLARIRGIEGNEAGRRLDQLARALLADGELDRPVAALSNGAKRKAMLLAAMIHAPPLLFLDEPFEGIDPFSARTIREMLERLCARGVTVFLTSHVLPFVESLASHVGILSSGRLIASGTLDDVVAESGSLETAMLETLGTSSSAPDLEWYTP
ncbi:MAG: ABC transporter ATP-binding protein [Acidobacteriota bacterium]|nr:ABC transporter ATP-binding protein [Acidobacteriota bacterium]